jgi:hypothetical protein
MPFVVHIGNTEHVQAGYRQSEIDGDAVRRYRLSMDTVALDTTLWDLDVDASGNWRTVGDATGSGNSPTGPGMRLAQDVATRCLSWRNEVYYDTTQGINYPNILGGPPNMALVNNAFQSQAVLVTGCAQALANFVFTAGVQRKVSGSMVVTDITGSGGVVTA